MRDLKADLQWVEENAPEAHPVREFIERAMMAENTLSALRTILYDTDVSDRIALMQEVLTR